MTGERSDPRPARSRARLLDAATALLRSGGPSAVTIDAVTRSVQRGQGHVVPPFLQRQRSAGRVLHDSDTATADAAGRRFTARPPDRHRGAWAESIAEAPITPDRDGLALAGPGHRPLARRAGRRRRVARRCGPCANASREQYSAPFDAILDGPQAARSSRSSDRTVAFALLIGPLASAG